MRKEAKGEIRTNSGNKRQFVKKSEMFFPNYLTNVEGEEILVGKL